MAIEVLLADDRDIIRTGMRRLIGHDPEIAVIGEAENLADTIRMAEELKPHLVIMDLGLTRTRLRPLLAPIAKLLDKLGPGDPYARPWDDLARFGEVLTTPFLLDLYYVCTVTKPIARPCT